MEKALTIYVASFLLFLLILLIKKVKKIFKGIKKRYYKKRLECGLEQYQDMEKSFIYSEAKKIYEQMENQSPGSRDNLKKRLVELKKRFFPNWVPILLSEPRFDFEKMEDFKTIH